MRQSIPLLLLTSVMTLGAPAARAETGLFVGGGLRWGAVDNAVPFTLHASVDVAPLLALGVDLHAVCADGGTRPPEFGGAAVSLLLAPPMPGGLSLELGLAAGVVPLTLERHGYEGLPAFAAAQLAATIDLGSPFALRVAFDHTLTSGDARRALESQLVVSIGVRL